MTILFAQNLRNFRAHIFLLIFVHEVRAKIFERFCAFFIVRNLRKTESIAQNVNFNAKHAIAN